MAGEQKERRRVAAGSHAKIPTYRRRTSGHCSPPNHHRPHSHEADAVRQDVLAQIDLTGQSKASLEDLLLGNQLTGAGGFNCVRVTRPENSKPRNVALGTRGSDIMTMAVVFGRDFSSAG